MADWNCPPGGTLAEHWPTRGRRQLGTSLPAVGEAYGTYPHYREPRVGGRRIDGLLVTEDAVVDRVAVNVRRPGGVWPSDHAAVHAVVRWPRDAVARADLPAPAVPAADVVRVLTLLSIPVATIAGGARRSRDVARVVRGGPPRMPDSDRVSTWRSACWCSSPWSSALEWYTSVFLWDKLIHVVLTGLLAALLAVIAADLRLVPHAPDAGRVTVSAPGVHPRLAIGSCGRCASGSGTTTSLAIYVGYDDTIGDLAATTLGGLLVGLALPWLRPSGTWCGSHALAAGHGPARRSLPWRRRRAVARAGPASAMLDGLLALRSDAGGGTPETEFRASRGSELVRAHGLWRSLVAHLTGGQGVAGSNPVTRPKPMKPPARHVLAGASPRSARGSGASRSCAAAARPPSVDRDGRRRSATAPCRGRRSTWPAGTSTGDRTCCGRSDPTSHWWGHLVGSGGPRRRRTRRPGPARLGEPGRRAALRRMGPHRDPLPRGRDVSKPFVDVIATSVRPDAAGLAELGSVLEDARAFSPLCFRVRLPGDLLRVRALAGHGSSVAPDQLVVAGPVSVIAGREQTPGASAVELVPTTPEACGAEGRRDLRDRPSRHARPGRVGGARRRGRARRRRRTGLLFEVVVDGRAAGVVAAARDDAYGFTGFVVEEIALDDDHRGQGLGPAVLRALARRLPRRRPTCSGDTSTPTTPPLVAWRPRQRSGGLRHVGLGDAGRLARDAGARPVR